MTDLPRRLSNLNPINTLQLRPSPLKRYPNIPKYRQDSGLIRGLTRPVCEVHCREERGKGRSGEGQWQGKRALRWTEDLR